MDESSGRSVTPVGFLRRGSGISLRDQSNENRPSQYNNKPGKSTNLNTAKARFTENREKPRYLHGPFHSSASKASSVGSSKAPVRKYFDEKQKRPFLAEADTAESSNRRTEVRHIQNGKKAVVYEDGYPYTQMSTSEGSSARTVDFGNTALSATERRQRDREELNSGCSSSDSVHNRRVEVTKKRTSDAGSSSRSRGISEQSNLGQPGANYSGSTGPRARAAEQSARTNSRSFQDSTDSARTRRHSTLRARERMPSEREDGVFALRETVTRARHPERGHFPTNDISPQRSIRPFYAELPHAIYSSNRQGLSSRTPRRRSTTHPEESPHQIYHGLFGERDGYRRINMEGIAEVLLALDRIEHDDELTYEQLVVLETNLLLSGLGLHDQHQDMRLDIDNMSYEELLALEEHIGSVSTALTEEQFAKCVNQSVYEARNSDRDANKIAADDVKCSICQEEYVEGEEIGMMQCEHQYHVCCIHEWLRQKNWCPICKASAVPSKMDKGDSDA
ncbi:unnamed protein product [Urochloa decumbens]|uniref:RING-type E3 ubiquitin transferase n=1 Tax=Urochloa decumbens TaxID=240449 RepID=A0ABC9DJX3_9POAL